MEARKYQLCCIELFWFFREIIGILIEHYAGKLLWISPIQAMIIPVSDEFDEYAKAINKKIKSSV